MRTKALLVVLLKLLLLHHACAYPESILSSEDETAELRSDIIQDDSLSMEELTTMTLVNELSSEDVDTAKKSEEMEQHTTFATTLDHTITPHEPSPVLMKLISPIESTKPFSPVPETSTERLDVKIKKMNQTKVVLEDTETPPADKKKGRTLKTKTVLIDESESVDDTTPLADTEIDSNETNIETSEEITTNVPPSTSSKRPPKNIEIFKTRPNELLRFYVEDGHLRSPIAALVDKKKNPLGKAKRLWKAALRPNSLLDIMVVSYDSEGIKSSYNLTNTKAMMSTLDKVKEENATDNQKSKTYYAILRTGQLIPFDSAIFVTTDDIPSDAGYQYQASMYLLKKRIRLYLIIFDGKNNSTRNETTGNVKDTGFLGRLAMLTGGDIIYVPNYVFQNQNDDGEMGYITLYRRNKIKPIDHKPITEFHENELKNDTETLTANDDDELNDSNN